MSFICLLEGQRIDSIQYSSDEWEQLKKDYRFKDLTMICCGAKAIPKTHSTYGTQFFAHKARMGCVFQNKTSEYLFLIYMIAKSAKEIGWNYQIFYESDENCVADILIFNDKVKIYFNIGLNYNDVKKWDEKIKNDINFMSKNSKTKFVYLSSHYYENDCSIPLFTLEKEKVDVKKYNFKVKHIVNINSFNINSIFVEHLDFDITDFIKLLLSGKIQNLQSEKSKIILSTKLSTVICQFCHHLTNFILGFKIYLNINNRNIELIDLDRKRLNLDNNKYSFLKELIYHEKIFNKLSCGKIINNLNSCFYCKNPLGNIYEYECKSFEYVTIDYDKTTSNTIKNKMISLNNWFFID